MIPKSSNGFTIIEILIAMAIFAIGILGVAKMQMSATNGTAKARMYTEALTSGQDIMEYLLLLPYGDPALNDTDLDGTNQDLDDDGDDDDCNCNDFGLDDNTTASADHTQTRNNIYTVYWNIAVDEPVTGSKTIRLFVEWHGGLFNKQIELESVKPSI